MPVNCSALPRELADSMLFGHTRGAFTGADSERAGYFEAADEGTLFLDELGEMPLELQAKLLRVLEDGEVWRLGARQGIQVDVRLVAATNADLQERIRQGTFRQDLYFRVARFTITAPPLRERGQDVGLLADHFLRTLAAEMGREPPQLTHAARSALLGYGFPGNIRELRNVVERALLECRGGDIDVQHLYLLDGSPALPADGESPEAGQRLPTLEEAEKRHIQRALERCNWVIRGNQGAARILGVPESTLRGKVERLGISRP